MSLRIRFQYTTGASLGYSIERLADGLFFDFSSSTFTVTPTTLIAALPEDSGNYQGRYKLTLTTTPSAQFINGGYAITIHNTGAGNLVVGELPAIMYGGDDAPVVIVGTNNDKVGYALASNGLDTIQVESGINARQALSPILASAAGVLLGAGTGTIIIKGANVATTRITATTDNAGNRSAVTLTLPT